MTPMAELIIQALARGCSDLSLGPSWVAAMAQASFGSLMVKAGAGCLGLEVEFVPDAGTSTAMRSANVSLPPHTALLMTT